MYLYNIIYKSDQNNSHIRSVFSFLGTCIVYNLLYIYTVPLQWLNIASFRPC